MIAIIWWESIHKPDIFPELLATPLKRDACVKWGQDWIVRSRGFADQSKFGAMALRPVAIVLTNLTGSAGLGAALKTSDNYDTQLASSIVLLTAIATAVNFVVGRSNPERLYVTDRIQQFLVSRDLHFFIHNLGDYQGIDDDKACRLFVERVLTYSGRQLGRWALDGGVHSELSPPHSA